MLSLRRIGFTAARVAVNDDPTRLAQRCLWTTAWLGTRWEKKNLQVYPPQGPEEPRRPAEVYHCRRQIKYSKDKMWYIAKLIRGMSIDQAIAQLGFLDKKGAKIAQEVLKEAQEMAVKDHNVEYRSNLYVESCECLGKNVRVGRCASAPSPTSPRCTTHQHPHLLRLQRSLLSSVYLNSSSSFEMINKNLKWYLNVYMCICVYIYMYICVYMYIRGVFKKYPTLIFRA
uniref:Large ribosomal subunit protein uL22m n=1 Tax=Eptatretus burgeri TaxID=7764 RepID=A0A8C4R6N8_EPTBU